MSNFVGVGATLSINGTNLGSVNSIDYSCSVNMADVTHSTSEGIQNLPGHADPGTLSVGGLLDFEDAGQSALEALRTSKANAALVVSCPDESDTSLTVSLSRLQDYSLSGLGTGEGVTYTATFKCNAHPTRS